MLPIVIGAAIGLAIAWLILVSKSSFRLVSPTTGEFSGPGCVASMLLYLVLGGIGAAIGFFISMQ